METEIFKKYKDIKINAHKQRVFVLDWNCNGKYLATADNTIKIWKYKNMSIEKDKEIKAHSDYVEVYLKKQFIIIIIILFYCLIIIIVIKRHYNGILVINKHCVLVVKIVSDYGKLEKINHNSVIKLNLIIRS